MKTLDTLRSVIRFGRIETDRVERRLATAASVADLRRIAKRRLPGGVFDYIDGGAEDERTLRANEQAFASVRFRPRVLRGVGNVDTTTSILGQSADFPLVLAPTGFTRIADPEGERTEITLTSIRTNTGLKDSDVQLTLPQGVHLSRPLGTPPAAAPR